MSDITLAEIRKTIILFRSETCRANNLLGFRKCADCPFNIADSNGKSMCFETDLELQFITTQPEVVSLTDGWGITIKRVGLLK